MKKNKKNERVEWNDIGYEFKLVFYNLAHALNKTLSGEDGKKKRK
jgi:hypothetical protein